jgi:hypothetical protein
MDLLDLNVVLDLKNDEKFSIFLKNEKYFKFLSLIQTICKIDFNDKTNFRNRENYYNKLDPINLEVEFLDTFLDFKLIADLLWPIYKNKINPTIDSIINIIFPCLEKIFIYEDGSCYYYEPDLQLYVYEKKYTVSLIKLIGFLTLFKTRLEKIMLLFTDSLLIILKKIENVLSTNDIKKIGNLVKRNHKIKFNNKSNEISYKNKILCLKTGKKRLRSRFDYYTDTIDFSYYPSYHSVPSYISSIFGDDKKNLDKIQKILGSSISGEPIDNIILFYGSGPNSKTTFINELSNILKSFQINLDYNALNVKDLKNKAKFDKTRLVTLDNIDTRTFGDIEYHINRLLSNRIFNFIGVIDNETFLKIPKPILKKYILIEFNFSFLQNPKGNLERKKNKNLDINRNFLFTWLCKGAMKYNYEQELENNIYIEFEEEEDIYASSEDLFDPSIEYLNYPEENKKKTKSQTIYIGSGLLQQKRNFYKIGKTKQDIEKRIKVYQTGRDIEDRFICLAHFPCYDCDTVESEIKKILNKIDPNHFNEVYNINYDIIYSIVKELTDKYNKEYEEYCNIK